MGSSYVTALTGPPLDASFFDFEVGTWQEPMVGGFAVENGMLIVTDELFEGAPVKTCYVWRDVHIERPYWEHNFSNDGGATWTCN